MKINYIIRSFPNPTETFIVNHVYWLEKENLLDTLYIKSFNKNKIIKFNDIQELGVLFQTYPLAIAGLQKLKRIFKLIINRKTAIYIFKYYLFFFPRNLKPFYDILYLKDFDAQKVTHIQFNTSIGPLKELRKINYLQPLKVIITFHGYDAFRLSKNLYEREYKYFYDENVKFVTVNSNYVKNHLISVGIEVDKIKIVPVGVDLKTFNTVIKPKSNLLKVINIISVGRLIQLKGHKYGVEAVAKLKKQGFAVKYTIIGDGLLDFKHQLKQYVEELNCSNEVHFLGLKSQEEIKNELLKNDIFYMLSTFDDNTNRKEAFGVAAIEAQASGLPVVGFNSGGVPEAIIHEKTGFIVKDRSVEEIVKVTKKLISNNSMYKNMSKEARFLVEKKFDNEKLYTAYKNLYQESL